jgi:hypothetical protein
MTRIYTPEELEAVAFLCGWKLRYCDSVAVHPLHPGHEPYPNLWKPWESDADNYHVLVAVYSYVDKHPAPWGEVSEREQAAWIEVQQAFAAGDPSIAETMQRIREAVMQLAILIGTRVKKVG